jgi:peptidyl-dipeptidase A
MVSVQRAVVFFLLSSAVVVSGQELKRGPAASADTRAAQFIQYYETTVRPLEIEVNQAWWVANTTGSDADFEQKETAENRLNETLADNLRFKQLESIRNAGVNDPELKRQIDLLYLIYLGKQVDPQLLKQITAKANRIEKAFNVYRAKVGDKKLTDSEIRKVLAESRDSERRRAVWEASKAIGSQIEAEIKELVVLRNDAARRLGFNNYHALQLNLNEQDPQQVLKLFDELDELTREPFRRVKEEIDQRLAESYSLTVDELRPWHYHDPFFQEAPDVYDADLDQVFAEADILAVCRKFYSGIGLPIDNCLQHSDLYERAGKSPHAFCTDIDREGDVRVLANIKPNEYWMTTMLHELGHAVYSSKFIPPSLPYVLRRDAHILTTEGLAMMFERFAGSSAWLGEMGVMVPNPRQFDEVSRKKRRNKLLIFSRWCQVMFRFEMKMYEEPTRDLNRLWWDLVERYQLVRRPEGRDAPDYASKVHVVSAPAYYHNYMMGELFACQLHQAIARSVVHSSEPVTAIYWDDTGVGQFLKEELFAVGARLPWDELTRQVTGERLNAKAFAAEFAEPTVGHRQ